MMKNKEAKVLLQIGIAGVFSYAAIASFLAPQNWIGYFPQFMQHLLPGTLLLNFFSCYELLLALWLLSGKYLIYSALLAAMTLSGIVVFNLGILDIVFRDIGIMLSSLALAFLAKDGLKQ